MFCDACGHKNRKQAKFCRRCGQSLADAAEHDAALDRHERLSRLFLEAAGLTGEERDAFLARECAGDPGLRDELLSLLEMQAAATVSGGATGKLATPVRHAQEDLSESPTVIPTAPRRLAERYVLGDVLGSGGMGVVHRGHDPSLDRPVAIKILRAEHSRDPAFVERFLKEARIAARLRHPHIVSIHEVGMSERGHYYVMDFIDGETLRDVVKRRGPLPEEDATRILLETARAVSFAHESTVLHRDLKPENVMIDAQGNVIVLDFGLARAADDPRLTRAGTVMGSPLYMSPEQMRGEPLDPRSDIFSIGLIFFYMLTGRNLYRGDTVSAVIECQRSIRISEELARARVPPGAMAPLEWMLARDPRDRAADLGEIIRMIRAGEGVTSGPPEEPDDLAAERVTRDRLRRLLDRLDPDAKS